MTETQIDKLLSKGIFQEVTRQRNLVETHISWVILCDRFVYKLKKPIKYSFLDFSTAELRKHFCERELELNQRFSKDIYLEVLPVYLFQGNYSVGGTKGRLVDYALKMRKLDPEKQMDVLVTKNKVTQTDIENLAERIAEFHTNTTIINAKNLLDGKEKFNDLALEKEFLKTHICLKSEDMINRAIKFSDTFLENNRELLKTRLKSGFFRDCHGDLHTRNIFLLPEPQPFDCIEFNDGYRHIDVLNEVAFLCMDLDALGRKDLSEVFIANYNHFFPAMRTEEERRLFIYYKSYRANVRAKVNSLRAKSATNAKTQSKALDQARKYLELMESYMKRLRDV